MVRTNRQEERLLTRLEETKRSFGPRDGVLVEKLLAALERRRFRDARSLIRFHDALLFLRAYPHSRAVLRRAEELLGSIGKRVAALRAWGEDISPLEEPEVSGIAGTAFSGQLSYEITRRLAALHPGNVDIDWENYEISDRLAPVWRRLCPLIEDDSLVEANVPYREWLRAAMGDSAVSLAWILERIERLPLPPKERAELFDSLALPLVWSLGESAATRTLMRRPVRRFFYHSGPLLKRSDVSFEGELAGPPLPLRKLPPAEGALVLDLARQTSAARYRELYGFTFGDNRHVLHAEAGRGVEIFWMGLPPQRRLPIRAYHAALIFKNGVPVGYVETLTLSERMEVGFNLYPTFREGETAWLFARLLHLFHQILGVTYLYIDPYQIGLNNEEGIQSGAFWFYRKLGFRPIVPQIAALAEREERRIRENPSYRTPPGTLRRLSAGPMMYEMPGVERGLWDRFRTRNVGLAIQRRMAEHYRGDAARIRKASVDAVSKALGVPSAAGPAFENLALVLALIPGLARWTPDEKGRLVGIIQAKSAPEESRFVRLLQTHPRLRQALLDLGSLG